MRVQAAKRAVQLREWAAQINERIQSGQSIKAWCAKYDLSPKTYYYRLKRVREELLEEAESTGALNLSEKPVFAKLPVGLSEQKAACACMSRSDGLITIRMYGYSVEIQNGADNTAIEHVLQVLSRL